MQKSFQDFAILESHAGCALLLGPDGSLLRLNSAAWRALEADSMAEVQNRLFQTFIPGPERGAFCDLMGRVFTGESGTQDFVVAGLKGARHHWELSASPVRGEGGGITAMLGIAADISARKQAEQHAETERLGHLRFLDGLDQINRHIQSANSLEQVLANAVDVVLTIFDSDRAYLLYPCDPLAATWTVPMERTRPEYPGVREMGVTVPMDPEVSQTFRAALETDGPVRFGPEAEHPLPRGVSERFDIQSSLAMALRPRVGPPWLFGIHQCSHARVWTPEEARLFQEIARRLGDGLSSLLIFRDLREHESKLAEAERVAHVGYWERDFDCERLILSEEARRILGLPTGEEALDWSLWRERWRSMIHPEDRARTRQSLSAALKGEQPYDVEYRIVRPDGNLRVVRSQGEAKRDAAGKPRRMFGILQDITERRQLEEQLRQAQKMEAIGQLAGGVAHDFNNILTSVLMQIELSFDDPQLSPELAESLTQIGKDAQRAANLTRQLLLFSRRQVMQTRNLDLNESVTNLAKMLQRIIGEDIRLQLHLHPAPLITRADAGMLDQVVMNLAVNARDAMPEGGNLVVATSETVVDETLARKYPEAAPGRYACLSVSDTGCGISPEILPRVFEPFFTTKEPGKGTGLGLATVFGIVKQHHGWVNVSSEPGRGASFEIYLPVVDTTKTAGSDTSRFQPRGGTETILFVEDEPSVRKATRAVLTRHGYTIIEAANGVDALALWEEHRAKIALLLTDLVMPSHISGLQLAQRLQADNPNLRVIYISGHSAEIAGRQIELRPGDNFLQKPFAPAHLLTAIRGCLDA